MDFGIQIDGDRRAVLRFEQFPAQVHDRLLATLTSLEQRLEAAVVAAEPSLSGQLRALTGGRVYDHGDRIAAVVGVRTQTAQDARKAAALEYGSNKTVAVRAHAAKLAHIWARAISPITVQVSASTRLSNLDPRRFLRDPIEAIRATALEEMRQAVSAAVGDAS
jgi:hypothetical protein